MSIGKDSPVSYLRQQILEEVDVCLSELRERVNSRFGILQSLLPARDTKPPKKVQEVDDAASPQSAPSPCKMLTIPSLMPSDKLKLKDLDTTSADAGSNGDDSPTTIVKKQKKPKTGGKKKGKVSNASLGAPTWQPAGSAETVGKPLLDDSDRVEADLSPSEIERKTSNQIVKTLPSGLSNQRVPSHLYKLSSTDALEPIVVASCPEHLHDEVWEYCKTYQFAKAFGMKGDMVDMLTGDDWFSKWEAKVVMTAVTKATSMNAEYVKILCIQGGPHCDKEMAAQARLKKAIKQEYGADSFRVQLEWIEMEDFREKYCTKPESPLSIFFSYRLANAFDAAMNLKMRLEEMLPDAEYFFDISQTDSIDVSLMKVQRCSHFLLYLTKGIMSSKLVSSQIQEALRMEKEIILVTETNIHFGAPNISALASECSEEVRHVLQTNIAIPWSREQELQEVSLDRLFSALSVAAPSPEECTTVQPRSHQGSTNAWTYGVHGGSVLDDMFYNFCCFSGVPLPGSSKVVRIWQRVHQLICFLAFSSAFTSFMCTKGPAYRNQLDSLMIPGVWLIVVLNEIAFQKVLFRPELNDFINNSASNPHMAEQLRKSTRKKAKEGILLALVITALIHVLYTQSFFHSFYTGDLTGEKVAIFVQGVMFVMFSVPFSLKIMALAHLSPALWDIYRSDVSCAFCQLHGQIAELGVEKILEHGLVVHISDSHFVRFQIAFMDCWWKVRRTEDTFMLSNATAVLLWFSAFCVQTYNTVKLLKHGKPHDSLIAIDGDRWYLSIRPLILVLLDYKFVAPFLIGTSFENQLKRWATHLIYANPASRTAAVNLMSQLSFCPEILPTVRASRTLLPYVVLLLLLRIFLWSIEFYIMDL